MTKELTVKAPDMMILDAKSAIAQALPRMINSDRFVRVAVTEIRRNLDLLKCDPLSVCSAVMQSAALGLEFGALLGQAYLVPFGKECTLMVGYKGKIALLVRTGVISKMVVRAVYDGDEFSYDFGLNEDLRHKPCGTQENLTHVYAIAHLPNGEKIFEVMSRGACEQVRDRYVNDKNKTTTWKKSFDEMCKKTVIHRICKLLPMTPDFADLEEKLPETEKVFDIPETPVGVSLIEAAQNAPQVVSAPQTDKAREEVNRLFTECDQLGINTDDFPIKDYSPDELFDIIGTLRDRIAAWKKSSASKT